MCRQAYPSDVSDEEWKMLAPLIPKALPGGHPRTTDLREVINAILYLDRTGAQWRALPHDFPRLFDRVELLPQMAHRWDVEAHPHSAARAGAGEAGARADAQCRHHRQPIGENERNRGRRGYDGGKHVKGGIWHLLVDTTGLIVSVLVHEATIQDHDGGKELLWPLQGCLPRLQLIWADSAYKKGGNARWVKEVLGWKVEIVEHPWSGLRGVWAPKDAVIDWEKIRPRGFHVLTWRWIVERTFAWLSTWRRLAKDYEVLKSSEEAWIYVAMIRIMVRRLAQNTS